MRFSHLDFHLVRKRSFFEFSLCLSRACLGKIIVYIYKWLKKTVFHLIERFRRDGGEVCHPVWLERGLQKRLFSYFSYVCPEPCLGKCSVAGIKKDVSQRTEGITIGEPRRASSSSIGGNMRRVSLLCRKVSSFQLFLCLSRACLGKFRFQHCKMASQKDVSCFRTGSMRMERGRLWMEDQSSPGCGAGPSSATQPQRI